MPYLSRAQDGTAMDTQPVLGQWRPTGEMCERREYAGGIRLKDGKILAVSGHPLEGKSIGSAELYDPGTGAWSDTGSLRQPRNGGNAARLLSDGRVLLAGGHSNTHVVRGAELYDPKTRQWNNTGSLRVGRDPVVTALVDGRVLASGGFDWYIDSGKVYALAELYDPLTDKWTVTGSLHTARNNHRTCTLDDGSVLAVGGYAESGILLASAELYDPSTGKWEAAEALPAPRGWFGLVKLRDRRVLVAGGYTGRSSSSRRRYLASVVIYNPQSGCWRESQPMQEKRAGFSITLLSDGQVLVAGGVAESGLELRSAELFDPRTETWRAVASMNTARRNHSATLLRDGRVIVIGGSNSFGGTYLRSCEIFSL
jgi:N-acetylneuraminic acid mutarotase